MDKFSSTFRPQKEKQNCPVFSHQGFSESNERYLKLLLCTTDTGNNPMVGMTVAVAVAIEEASK